MASRSSWRTSFLTLRDFTQSQSSENNNLPTSLLHSLFFEQSSFTHVASHLPLHEVMSDVIMLIQVVMEIADNKEKGNDGDEAMSSDETMIQTCHLVHDVSCNVSLEMNASSWVVMLDFCNKMARMSFGGGNKVMKVEALEKSKGATRIKVVMEVLEILRNLVNGYGRMCSFLETNQLFHLLLHIIACAHAELFSSSDLNNSCGTRFNLWEVQTLSFVMIGEVLSRTGTIVSVEIWLSVLEVLRKVMDVFTSKVPLVEDNVMSRFYTSVLQCMHLILSDPKSSLSDHVGGLLTALRIFFVYGLTRQSTVISPNFGSPSNKSTTAVPPKVERGPYRPPHLRKREGKSSSGNETATALGFTSSDSESDSDGFGKDADYLRSSKIRIAAITCIQDLCQAEPKSLTMNWTLLLPTSDVLRPRKYDATLMTCLLFDPYMKARIISASALAAILSSASTVFLQVAEFKESSKSGSFTALSSSLGQILVQLHAGILHLIEHESHSGIMTSLLKVLILLISSTPYPRMPRELLPSVISSLRLRMIKGFSSRIDQTGLMVITLSCLGVAFSISPPLIQVKDILIGELTQRKAGLLSILFQYSEREVNATISLEALQVLRVLSHNYPNVMTACWEQVSNVTYKLLKGSGGNPLGLLGERSVAAAIRVLDECLRGISGFRGIEDNLDFDERSHDTPFTSDSTRAKKVLSAPSYETGSVELLSFENDDLTGTKQWEEAIEKHLPIVVLHKFPMVRAASVTCFAGITSSVFSTLGKEHQDFILNSTVKAAVNDEVPSVRSAACRSIGIIGLFPQINQRMDILDKLVHAAELNTRDPLVSVRITASWAIANLCDSMRHRAKDSMDSKVSCSLILLLADCALRLTKDGEKIKSNAVRALGCLSRFVRFTSTSTQCNETELFDSISLVDSDWLGRMVQAFVSCVTTGNVKVRWNVCHALSYLFLNETVKLQDMAWAPSVFSILLLLLRDSSNFKIRIHAAAALSVPSSRLDYGSSYPDVVQALHHVLETQILGLDQQNSTPSSYRYRDALEKQLTSTSLHVLGLASFSDYPPLKDFFTKKAAFLEDWLKQLCSLSLRTSENVPSENQKKEIIFKTIKSLVHVYECSGNHGCADRFEKLMDGVS